MKKLASLWRAPSLLLFVAVSCMVSHPSFGNAQSIVLASSTATSVSSAATSTGSLTATLTTVAKPQTFDLSALGTTDWAAWGDSGFDHSSTGDHKIGNVTTYGGGSLNSFDSSFLGMAWSGGTPSAVSTNETKGYYNDGGVGDGFIFTVPASTTKQTLTVFVGGYTSGATLMASLSDGSAQVYRDSSLSGPAISYYGYYTLTYKAGSANQTLVVVWKQASGTGNVTIYSAALH